MRASIQATNVVLNLAVVPNVILMPSNFVILDKKIEGYNNILTTATEEMSFGINKNVNYSEPAKHKPKREPNDLLNDHVHNDVNNERGNSSNAGNNGASDNDDSTVLFREGKSRANTAITVSGLGLPIVFFLSMTVGVLASKKIF